MAKANATDDVHRPTPRSSGRAKSGAPLNSKSLGAGGIVTSVREVLDSGSSYRLDDHVDWESDLEGLQATIASSRPPDYIEFLQLGGLLELNFEQRVLSPAEIVDFLELGGRWVGILPR